jgi:uncharacterized membrane protein (DUF373 family)
VARKRQGTATAATGILLPMDQNSDTKPDAQPTRSDKGMSLGDRMTRGVDAGFLGSLMKLLEWAVAALLVVMTLWGVVALAVLIFASIWNHAITTKPGTYIEIIDATLVVFIVIELFRVAVAYVQHRDVVPTVMEAALVAVARKVLVIDPGIDAQQLLWKGVGLGVLILAIGATWYLLRRSGVGLDDDESRVFGKIVAKRVDAAAGPEPDPDKA